MFSLLCIEDLKQLVIPPLEPFLLLLLSISLVWSLANYLGRGQQPWNFLECLLMGRLPVHKSRGGSKSVTLSSGVWLCKWWNSYSEDTGTAEPAWCASRFDRQTPPSDTGSGRAARLTHKLVPRHNRSPCSKCSAQTAAPPDSQTHCCTGSPVWILQRTHKKERKRAFKR